MANFPVSWKCQCGSERRVTQEAWKSTHNGQAPEETFIRQIRGLLAAPPDLVPHAVHILYDICYDCGTEYPYRAVLEQGHVQMVPKKEPLLRN